MTAAKAKTKRKTNSASTWWLYVLECRGPVFYTGIAKDVDARFQAHLNGTGARFTRSRPPIRILAKAPMTTKAGALRAEHALKQLSRAEKLRWCIEGLEHFVALVAERNR